MVRQDALSNFGALTLRPQGCMWLYSCQWNSKWLSPLLANLPITNYQLPNLYRPAHNDNFGCELWLGLCCCLVWYTGCN
jgi:hypothetical protein